MAGISYDFDRRPLNARRPGTQGGRTLRLIVLFIAVALVTGIVIWALIPAKNTPGNAGEKASSQELSNGGGSGTEPLENQEPSAGTPAAAPSGEENSFTGPGNSEEVPGKPAVQNAPGGNPAAPAVSNKDRVTPEDPPETLDQPSYRKNGGAQFDAAQFTDADALRQIAKATDLLMKESAAGGEFSTNWLAAGRALTQARIAAFHSGAWQKEAEEFRVPAGWYLSKIALKKQMTVEGIRKLNKLKNNNVGIQQKLFLLPGPWKISVSRSARLLNLWRQTKGRWQIFAVFEIGVGRKGKTPVGDFHIAARSAKPKYHGPHGEQIPYGDPANPLGEYMLTITGKNFPRNYGIHGTRNARSVGRSLSEGCIRMRNEDVEILYELLPEKTPGKIVD